MTTEERWLPVLGHPKYEVSDLGRVRWVGMKGHHVCKPVPGWKGYLRVTFWMDGKTKKIAVHKLVAEAFLGPRPTGYVARHLNGIVSDCRAANLAWGTPTENEADKALHGTKVQGSRHPVSKLTEDQVRAIRARYVPRDPRNHLRAIAADYALDVKTVEAIVKRRAWKHVA